jgi:hypothetical protein
MNRLLQIGFLSVGSWQLEQNRITSILNQCSDTQNLIYCFIIDAVPKYFGITRNSLRARMYQYSNPGRGQSTNIRINGLLVSALQNNHLVEIYIFRDSGLLQYGNFTINLALGLEETLINFYQSEWNYRGNNRIIELENQNIEVEINEPLLDIVEDDLNLGFEINLIDTYRRGGFLNIPAQFSDHFEGDGDAIRVQFGQYNIMGRIDRRNNNGYPRIQVGLELTNWIRELPPIRNSLNLHLSNNCLRVS